MTDHDREQTAKLVESMIDQKPWKDQVWSRMALAIAARAIRRGRHLTESEKLHNLADAMEADDVDDGLDMAPVVADLRRLAGPR